MRFSEAKGRKVVSTASATTVGQLDDAVIDPASRAVAALLLKKTPAKAHALPWGGVDAFGEDAVMVRSEDVLVEPTGRMAELDDKRYHQHGKRVLSTEGVDLGEVDDFDFDPTTGALVSLILKGDKADVDGGRLLGVGSYAVVVQASTDSSPFASGVQAGSRPVAATIRSTSGRSGSSVSGSR